MKIKISEATNLQLNYLVANALNIQIVQVLKGIVYTPCYPKIGGAPFQPTTDWALAGPIIEREEISIKHVIPAMKDSIWQAHPSLSAKGASGKWGIGPTPLIAAMRCYVASRLGNEVEVPDELS